MKSALSPAIIGVYLFQMRTPRKLWTKFSIDARWIKTDNTNVFYEMGEKTACCRFDHFECLFSIISVCGSSILFVSFFFTTIGVTAVSYQCMRRPHINFNSMFNSNERSTNNNNRQQHRIRRCHAPRIHHSFHRFDNQIETYIVCMKLCRGKSCVPGTKWPEREQYRTQRASLSFTQLIVYAWICGYEMNQNKKLRFRLWIAIWLRLTNSLVVVVCVFFFLAVSVNGTQIENSLCGWQTSTTKRQKKTKW